MAAPTLLVVYPDDGDTGIPTGASIKLDFDRGIDVLNIKDYVVLYGSDFDQTSGPDSLLWVDSDTGDNPFFLRSPGFKGLVDLSYNIVYYDLDTGDDIGSSVELTSEVEELAYNTGGIGHRVYITPTVGSLAPDLEYTLHIIGDPDSQGTGISSRTCFSTVPDPGNTSDTGIVYVIGGYTGPNTDSVVVEITTAGDIGTAKYKWYYTSSGSGSAVYDKLTNRRYRSLADGLQIRFTGTDFAVGDTFVTNVEPAQRLATSSKIVFTTNDGSYTAAPSSPSTPAPSEPPAEVLPPAPGEPTSSDYLQVIEMLPPDGSYNVSTKTRTIQVIFSEDLNSGTITNSSVRIYKYPVLGYYNGQPEVVEMQKKLTVSGQTLTIEI